MYTYTSDINRMIVRVIIFFAIVVIKNFALNKVLSHRYFCIFCLANKNFLNVFAFIVDATFKIYINNKLIKIQCLFLSTIVF